MLGVNEVYNWQCLKSIRVMHLNISSLQSEMLIICQTTQNQEEVFHAADKESFLHF